MALTVLYQAVIMLLLIIVGIICAKINMISEKTCKELSSLLLSVVNPIMILLAYQKEFKKELLENLVITLGLSFLSVFIAMAVAYLVIRKNEKNEAEIERFSLIYSNCAFMGMPLINAMYGYDGVFYLTAFLTVFNLLVWSHGVIIMSGQKDFKSIIKVFYSPTFIAIFVGLITFAFKITFPSLLSDTLEYIANLNTPLAMLVAGATIARSGLLSGLKKPKIYLIAFLKLLVIPCISAFVLSFFPVDSTVKFVVVIATAAPSATMCTLFSLKYNKNSSYASEIFAVTTFLSTLTLPLMAKLTNLLCL
jgi:hypothetical protein